MLRKLLPFLFLQVTLILANNEKYIVIGPGTIHSENTYTVSVGVHEINKPCQINVGITGPSYNETKNVLLETSKQLKNVDFQVPVLELGDYNLTAEAVNCLDNFRNTTNLFLEHFENYVRIQTDKGLYKQGDTVNYRVIFLDKDLRPAKPNNNASIWFEDGKRNRIKEIHGFDTVMGVYTGAFQIPEYPEYGNWRLGVDNGGRYDRNVYFSVEKYVLPKFLVEATATGSVSVKDGDMQIIVKANYTFGKPLNGKVTVLVTPHTHYYYRSFHGPEHNNIMNNMSSPTIIKTTDMVQGKAKIDLNVKEFEAYLNSKTSPTSLFIVATVEEEFTGSMINATAYTTLFPYRYAMNCISYNTCASFRADNESDVEFLITYIDGSYLNDTTSILELTYTEMLTKYHSWYDYDRNDNEKLIKLNETETEPKSQNRVFKFTSKMNETGHAVFKVKLPALEEYKGHSHFYTTELKYKDETRSMYSSYMYREPKMIDNPINHNESTPEEPKDYFKLLPTYTIRYDVGESKLFTVYSSQPLSYINYYIVGRGNILESGHINLEPEKPKDYNLTLTPTFMWIPRFYLYVSYIDDKGDYHYAEQTYYVEDQLENQINITAPSMVKPGDEVTLQIKTAPKSFVALMAVDHSVLLLRSNNDLYSSEFGWLLGTYSTQTPPQGGYSYYPGTKSGVVTLTNANYYYNRTKPDYLSTLHSGFGGGLVHNRVLAKTAAAPLGATTTTSQAREGQMYKSAGDEIQIRKDFSEIWLFDNIESTEKEEFNWTKKIPDTITSWHLTAFAMNQEKGLALTGEVTKIVTFKPFFISIRLPYSVKRGEVINVPALVFNYLNKSLNVEVTLDNSDDEYEFLDVTNEVLDNQKELTKMIEVPANGAAGVSFLLKPKVLGNIMLKYLAKSPIAGDGVHKTLKVVPEGVTKYKNRAFFINLPREKREIKTDFELELPEDVVPDSQHVDVGVMGDILGPVLKNLNNLIRKPSGCGEQTMSKLLPNYLVMKYLKQLNKLDNNLETKLIRNMEDGYQNMMHFRHPDGSFSSFGYRHEQENDKLVNGSTWLTAYVIRSLQQIGEFITIDHNLIESGLEYLTKMQNLNGSFKNRGDYFYGANREDIILTSTVLLAFAENKTLTDKYSSVVNKGLEYLFNNIHNSTESVHGKALATYTLNKFKHPQAEKELEKLKSLAKKEEDRKWWSDKEEKDFDIHHWWRFIYTRDIETTSYALLAHLEQMTINVEELLPIIRWLIAQRNSYGGFVSSQDTIVGLQALIKFVERSNYTPAEMEVEVSGSDGERQKRDTIHLNADNGLLYQTIEMPAKTKSVEFLATGTGTALVQISYQYNVLDKEMEPSFDVHVQIYSNDSAARLIMDVCAEFRGDSPASNMALMEISLPSGYIVDEDIFDDIKKVKSVSNIEVKNMNSLLVVYFNHLYKMDEQCVPVEALRSHPVAEQKPSSVKVYDYYDNSRKATIFYQISSKLCDICEGKDECHKCK